jgi:hypothetical protein
MSGKVQSSLTEDDTNDGKDIEKIMKDLDPCAQKLILERLQGMRQMQEILTAKTA